MRSGDGQAQVQTVLGPIPVETLGRTLMHEHLQIGVPGWQLDQLDPPVPMRDLVMRCVDQIEELKSEGYSSLVDPCPNDLGRDVELMREVALRTGFNIICSTGFYHGELGQSTYWKYRMTLDPDTPKRIADVLIKEISEGIGETGVRAGILKTATGHVVAPYDEAMLAASAQASLATGVPITTHTEGIHGDVQLDVMCGAGVRPERIVVGHSCGSNDFDYHRSLLDRGAFLGFDRFGLLAANTDERRIEALAKIILAGYGAQIVVSHDCVLCYRGMEWHRTLPEYGMLRFSRAIVPMLLERGVTQADIDRLLLDNPRRYFGSI